MKKLMVALAGSLCVALLTSFGAYAAEEEESGASSSLDVALLSAYVWRGQVLVEDLVAQPYLNVSQAGFSVNWWGNYGFEDDSTGDDNEFSEHDIGVSYGTTCPLTGADVSLGVINYDFPNIALDDGAGNVTLVNDTRELQFSYGFGEVIAAPTLFVAYDFKEADGFYFNVGVSHSIEVAEKVSVGVSASIGYADSDYNLYYFGVDDEAFNDGNIGIEAPVTITENLTLTPSLTYTFLADSDIEDAAAGLYLDDEQLYGGVTAGYVF